VRVSGYHHPVCEQLYDGWHRTEIRVTKPSASHSAAAARHAEVIWSNRPDGDSTALFPLTGPEDRDETTATGPTRVS
jgi:DNA adenine methylase